ncbi:cyclin-C1-1, putative [Entamoeba invadens IP1]|uniref:Cyclin-C1-1, putative n=1 Tax=Entamoeba invadens IP1 TaxID=370355 RepID=A0A0A1TZK3_ENTIV|nr:cyclin-C1-1, putative [Entamoeba invadens IP1]ELP86999.1 cyclin-C1-1, putative [Entamoeba invadens IP1]|eukprot:XP_004253770.1 cyclin-C1-1, putative [Entamoeba invadens IP1]
MEGRAVFEESSHAKYGLFNKSKLKTYEATMDWTTQWAVHIEIIKYIRRLCSQTTPHSYTKASHRIYSTSTVYYRRFFAEKEVGKTVDPRIVAASSVMFASKVEGCVISPQIIIDVSKKTIDFPFTIHDLIDFERTLIESMKHSLIVWHPEKDCEDIKNSSSLPEFFCETLQSILNDAYFTDVIVIYQPLEIALGCVVTAGILQNCDIRSLLCANDYNLENVEDVAKEMLRYYSFVNSQDFEKTQVSAQKYIGALRVYCYFFPSLFSSSFHTSYFLAVRLHHSFIFIS